ncbi:MAG: hypothetical protein AVDCRST_MAG93-9161 [uncultured Chloroflexia bacterium]|uniref:Uncharacterized protein n=1 Tax=uncultured Chloroflexia bacterium TaxID=1672391 RepID=A0A6J4NCC5_9CHLR|nr:MAG: hypothetical protein AVDCRST_MAG93-9161 [uncultured Chloroflexia bacterium]
MSTELILPLSNPRYTRRAYLLRELFCSFFAFSVAPIV